jgi:hypothetical protein
MACMHSDSLYPQMGLGQEPDLVLGLAPDLLSDQVPYLVANLVAIWYHVWFWHPI